MKRCTGRCAVFWFLVALGAGNVCAQFRISILGNEEISNTQIRNILPTAPSAYAAYILRSWEEEARNTLREYYTLRGFLNAIIDVRIERRPLEEGLIALVLVDEGSRFSIRSVEVLPVDEAELLVGEENLQAQSGNLFDYDFVLRDRRFILSQYAEVGFLNTQVGESLDIHPEDNSVTVTYGIERGAASLFDTLIIRNFQGDPPDEVKGLTRGNRLRSLIPYAQGDTITLLKNQRVLRMLRATGVFDSLDVDILPSPRIPNDTMQGETALVLVAREADPTRLRSSVFFDARFGFGGSVDLRHANIFGTLNQAGIGALTAQQRQSLFALYTSALTLGYLVFFENRIELDWHQDDEIHQVLETPLFEGDFQFQNRSQVTLPIHDRYRWFGSLELFARSRLVTPEERRRGLYLNLLNAFEFSLLDRALDPTRGSRFTLLWGNGGPLVLQDQITLTEARHNWLEAQSAYFYPLFEQLIGAARIDGGFFLSEGGINTARFFLGGARSVRSFRFRELCPRTRTVQFNGQTFAVCEETDVVPAYYLGSIELRLWPFAFGEIAEFGIRPYLRPLSTVLFTDYGNVWDLQQDFLLSGPGAGAAFGFGFRYPVARNTTLRLDFAWGWGGTRVAPFAWVIDLANAF